MLQTRATRRHCRLRYPRTRHFGAPQNLPVFPTPRRTSTRKSVGRKLGGVAGRTSVRRRCRNPRPRPLRAFARRIRRARPPQTQRYRRANPVPRLGSQHEVHARSQTGQRPPARPRQPRRRQRRVERNEVVRRSKRSSEKQVSGFSDDLFGEFGIVIDIGNICSVLPACTEMTAI